MVKRITAIGFVYFVAVLGWVFLASTITYRTGNQDATLKREVGQLWGTPLEQHAPVASLVAERKVQVEKFNPVTKQKIFEQTSATDKFDVPIIQNDIQVGFELDQRQKGLLWYSTYRVRFAANYIFENAQDRSGQLNLSFAFPAANGQYDEFKFEVDGKPVPFTRQNTDLLVASVPCEPKSRHQLAVNYASQGLDRFVYRFGDGISEVRNFTLVATTDFDGYDHPDNTLSPILPKERVGERLAVEVGLQRLDFRQRHRHRDAAKNKSRPDGRAHILLRARVLRLLLFSDLRHLAAQRHRDSSDELLLSGGFFLRVSLAARISG